MIKEAVKRTLSAKGVLKEGYGDNGIMPRYGRKTRKWSPYKSSSFWNDGDKPEWYDEDSEMTLFDNEAVQESIKEDIEDFKYAMEQIAEEALALVSWAVKKGVKPEYIKKPFGSFISASVKKSGGKEAKLYLNAKSSDTNESPWNLAVSFTQMSPEEQEADIQKYLIPALMNAYQSKYGEYQNEFNAAGDKRSEIMSAVQKIMDEYGQTDPSEMSYVDVCEGIKAIDDLMSTYYGSDARKFFEKHGLGELKRVLVAERDTKREEAPSYDLGMQNGWGEEQMGKFEELKKAMAHGIKYNSRSASAGESVRGYNYWSGDIVDRDGNLLATYRYGVDSSD